MLHVQPHVHVATGALPARVIATGVVTPYPLEADPVKIARETIRAYTRWVRPTGPNVQTEWQPEEIAMHAKRIADAMAQGVQMPANTDSRLIQAAMYILQGKQFMIKSAGRAALITPRVSAASYEAIARRNPVYWAMQR